MRLCPFCSQQLGSRRSGEMRSQFQYLKSEKLDQILRGLQLDPQNEVLHQEKVKEQQKLKREKFNNFCETLSELETSEMMKRISNFRKSIKKSTSSLANGPRALERYRAHFEKMNRNDLPRVDHLNQTDIEIVIESEFALTGSISAFELFHPRKILEILKKVAWNKSPGETGLSADFYKHVGKEACEFLSALFKMYFSKKMLPSRWKNR